MNSKQKDVKLVVVGSIGIDTIETPCAKRESILGGSASFACAAASFFSGVGLVGVVGTDFPESHRQLYQKFGIDLAGLQTVRGETFRWSGVYEHNMDNRRTLSTELNVFASFSPEIPPSYRKCPFLFLGNISPGLQEHVLNQMEATKFVLLDTMDLWINIAREDLLRVIKRVDMLTVNESEARLLTGEHGLIKAAQKLLTMGPKHILVKKGEHGSMLFYGDRIFLLPAFPLESVLDPTGAGDTFAGGLMGALASFGEVTEESIRKAMLYGNILASFGVEEFSLDRLARLDRPSIEARAQLFRKMARPV